MKQFEKTWYGPARYQIEVKGTVPGHWFEGVEGYTLSWERDMTILTGDMVDQSALHGILSRIGDMGAQLVLVRRLDDDPSSSQDHDEQ